jgi:hypothetical protein
MTFDATYWLVYGAGCFLFILVIGLVAQRLLRPRPVTHTSCWCQSCGADLCVHAVECVDPDAAGLVWYRCKCGAESQWDFDMPVPILMTHNGKPWVRS